MKKVINKWQADWIWYPKAQKTVNFHFFARKVFAIDSSIAKANLHIFAFTDYKLFINGKYLGRGPCPSDPYHFQYYDTYSIKKFLKEGKNVIGIICHNYGIGTHWQPMGPGGLIVQGEIETKKGTETITSDETWKVKKADCWYLNSPRMFWSCGFMETFDFRRYEENWLNENFDDSGWKTPQISEKHQTKPCGNLIPREIPFLREEKEKPLSIEKGKFKIHGFHTVSFDEVIPEGKNCIGYAQTYFYAEKETEVILRITCDDAFKIFLNNDLILEQNYDEGFARTRRWYGNDEYEQHHYGMGPTKESVKVVLKSGWNKVLAAIDQGIAGWGFSLSFIDTASEELIDIPFSNIKDIGKKRWTLAGPFESSGMNNSLNNILSDVIENFSQSHGGVKVINHDPFAHNRVTDYGRLMQAEERTNIANIPVKEEIIISHGEFCIVDFGKVKIGYPQLEISSSEEAIIDVGYNSVLSGSKNILFSFNVKYVDRIYLKKGNQKWETLQRRTGRYLHISCRKGNGIKLKGVGVNSLSYPVQEIGQFECSDKLLNRIWEVSKYTTKLLMQYGYQDCLRREEGSCNMSSFNYMSRSAGFCFGDYKLARKTIKLSIMTQNDTGWFDSHGISSPNSDEQNESLWWIVWLKDYYLHSGDILLVKEIYQNVANNLRFFSKMMNQYGLLDSKNEFISRKGQTVYIDDTASIPQYRGIFEGELFGYNIMYYAALNSAATLAEELGFVEDAEFYGKKAARVKKSCNERFWDDKKKLYVDWREGKKLADTSSQAILIAALYFGICDEDKGKKVLSYLLDLGALKGKFENYHLTFGFYYYLLEILFRYDKEDIALDLMRAYYGRWLELGATTFGEHFDLNNYKDKQSLDTEYEVHGYSTSAHLHFYTNILGIRPLEPGFKEILFEPHSGNLKSARGKVHTPKGEISVSWEAEKSSFKMEIEMPKECKYKVKLPKRYKNYQVRVNGKIYDKIG
ncbi:alpha-L-rhamnosidase N-terminal domain-containing protein [bacterium]|nr:alpha-L-rhamnosidase N-terminal domain-containing protein [bacterium]